MKIQVQIQRESQENKNLERNKDKDKWNVSVGKRPPTVLPDLGEKKPCQKSKGQFVVGEYKTKKKIQIKSQKLRRKLVVGEYKTKTKYNQNQHENAQIQDKHKHLSKVKMAICRWKRQSSAQTQSQVLFICMTNKSSRSN